jgi:hypothetical protein
MHWITSLALYIVPMPDGHSPQELPILITFRVPLYGCRNINDLIALILPLYLCFRAGSGGWVAIGTCVMPGIVRSDYIS